MTVNSLRLIRILVFYILNLLIKGKMGRSGAGLDSVHLNSLVRKLYVPFPNLVYSKQNDTFLYLLII